MRLRRGQGVDEVLTGKQRSWLAIRSLEQPKASHGSAQDSEASVFIDSASH